MKLIPITWWEEIAGQNFNFTKFIFIFRTLNKNCEKNIDTKRCKFQMQAVSQKRARKHWPAWSKITLLVPKCILIKTAWLSHTWLYMLIWVSPLFENQVRMHKQWGLISLYICNVWSMQCFPDNFEEKQSNKNSANKIHLSHVNTSMAKKEWKQPKQNAAKC